MFRKILFASIALIATTVVVSAQTSWLDRPMGRNWNTGDGNVPQAPRVLVAIDTRCREQIRTPDSLADRAVTRAGWSLFGPSVSFGQATIVSGMASTDGQCRPTLYNYFVFLNNRFAGTLSQETMNSRTDGSLIDLNLVSEANMTAEFARYRASDAMCCPSQRSVVNYRINGERSIVDARTVNTVGACPDDGGVSTQDNVITGTITYRGRNALPANAVISLRLLDAARQDISGGVIAEDRIEAGGKQVPISFDLVYDASRIQERNRYVVRAEIRDGERLLYTTDTSYPVITQGNPRSVEITVVSVGGGGGGNRQNVIRGTVTYRQRIALAQNSDARIWLVDSADPNGRPVAETTVQFGNRQVPLDFELPIEMRDINRQRNYEVQAEIRTAGQVRFRTERGVPVTLRGQEQTASIELILVPARPAFEPITGQNFDLSKLGAGSLQVENGSTMFLIGANVIVRSNGDASVRLSRLGGSVTFSGKLTFFDASTMRITVESSGNANAAGEIEVRYSGRSLGTITSRDLALDGQNVTVRF